MLKRRRPLPKIKSATGKPASSEQLLEYALEVNEVLRAEYTQKQCLAMEAIEKCTRMIQEERRNQLQDLEKCTQEKESLIRSLQQTQSKFDEIQQRQAAFSQRIESIQHSLDKIQPPLSQDEVAMRADLEGVQRKCVQYMRSLQELQERHQFQANAVTSDFASSAILSKGGDDDDGDSCISPDELRNMERLLKTQ